MVELDVFNKDGSLAPGMYPTIDWLVGAGENLLLGSTDTPAGYTLTIATKPIELASFRAKHLKFLTPRRRRDIALTREGPGRRYEHPAFRQLRQMPFMGSA
jgi:hypothetical protein